MISDEPSIQGIITTSSVGAAGIKVCVSGGFVIDHISADVLKIRYSKYSQSTVFVAPSDVYTNIHNKSVSY